MGVTAMLSMLAGWLAGMATMAISSPATQPETPKQGPANPDVLAGWLASMKAKLPRATQLETPIAVVATSTGVGALVGGNGGGAITASYGFGDVAGAATVSVDRADDADESIHSPAVLTATNSSTMPANQWNTDGMGFRR